MYGARHLKIALHDPATVFWEGVSVVNRHVLGREDPAITERDWDNLLLLDACRYDLFEECLREQDSFPGELSPSYSVASTTGEFIRRTFRGSEFPEIVCITSTPKYAKEEEITGESMDDIFYDIKHVWETDWSDEHGLVHPDVMTERVLEVANEYPNKRIFAHYIPPHVPFIGDTGKQMPHRRLTPHDGGEEDVPNVWNALKRGEYSRDEVWTAYKENLELTLPAVKRALDELTGKTVVTSDHGNALGEWNEFGYVGHGANHHINSLIKVPWLVHHNGDRKQIEAGDIDRLNGTEGAGEGVVSERLRDLGYAE